ncbi:CapA family protein [Arthrobacter sp. USHLN218]|uniref:CapA family protein n=1 Tax=Arthrobacter sp. USHLN218 TaxID=3081232 RepID=UPI003015D905
MGSDSISIFLAGDVMTGRGIDQLLPGSNPPRLRESFVHDARDYIALAEAVNGPIPRPVTPEWPWGEALALLDQAAPDLRIINLETSVTTSGRFAPGKGIHYRMHPGNIGCLTAAGIDACVLANNHVLDFGVRGLEETLDVLRAAGLRTAGAGRNAAGAWAPAELGTPGGRVLLFAAAHSSSGATRGNSALGERPGLAFLPDLSDAAADSLLERIRAERRPGDAVIVSLHWGSNWGYGVPPEQTRFAHRLVDGGADIIHGHSSHHPRPLETYRGRPVLYGCGDLINDYEGIRGYDEFRDDLRLLVLVTLDAVTHELRGLRLVPVRSRRLRLERAGLQDAEWLRRTLADACLPFRTQIEDDGEGGFRCGVP